MDRCIDMDHPSWHPPVERTHRTDFWRIHFYIHRFVDSAFDVDFGICISYDFGIFYNFYFSYYIFCMIFYDNFSIDGILCAVVLIEVPHLVDCTGFHCMVLHTVRAIHIDRIDFADNRSCNRTNSASTNSVRAIHLRIAKKHHADLRIQRLDRLVLLLAQDIHTLFRIARDNILVRTLYTERRIALWAHMCCTRFGTYHPCIGKCQFGNLLDRRGSGLSWDFHKLIPCKNCNIRSICNCVDSKHHLRLCHLWIVSLEFGRRKKHSNWIIEKIKFRLLIKWRVSIKMKWKLPNFRTSNTTNNKMQKLNRYIFGSQSSVTFRINLE